MACDQENPNAIPEGETPHNVTLMCYDPMTDMTKPGDRITVTGIYKAHPLRVNPRLRMLKTVYKANIDIVHIQRDETSTLFSVSERGPMNSDDGQPGNAQDTQNDGLFQVPPKMLIAIWHMEDCRQSVLSWRFVVVPISHTHHQACTARL